MKNLFYLLLTIPFFLASCSNEEMAQGEETVQVSFSAHIPHGNETRSTGSELNVVCAVFDNGVEVSSLRDTITTGGSSIVYSPNLIKGRTYNVVFWAMKDANYNVSDMQAISRVTDDSNEEADYDAFTATTSVTIQSSITEPVELKLTRPLAQLNIGITQEEWNIVAGQFGQTPKTTTITYQAKKQFNALSGTATGLEETNIQTSSAFNEFLTVDGINYKHLGMYYVLLAELEETTIDLTYTIKDTNDQDIRSDVQIPFVPVQRNYKTNIVGEFLTGTVNYQITIGDGFNNEEYNENI